MVKKIIKEIISRVLDYSGLSNKKIQKRLNKGNNWLVIMYHRIINNNEIQDPFSLGMCVNSKIFDQQIEYLKKNFQVLTVSEVIHRKENNIPLPKNVVSITFDDGYKDNLVNAIPIIQKHNIKASLYVATDILKGKSFCWDRVIYCLSHTKSKTINVKFPDQQQSFKTNSKDVATLLENLWLQSEGDRIKVVDDMVERYGSRKDLSELYLTLDEMRLIIKRNMEIGAHTLTHPNLEGLDYDSIDLEISKSKSQLEDLLGVDIKGFAYPGGFNNQDSHKVIKENNYNYALTTISGTNSFDVDKYLIKRMGAPNTSLSDFKRCLANVLWID